MTAATAPTREIGYAHEGVYNWWMYDGETTPELIWPQSVTVYDAMRRQDAQVASVLRAVTQPVRRTPWRIEPGQARDEVVQLVSEDLGLPIVGRKTEPAPRSRDRFSWSAHLAQALLMLPFGHMYFEQVYRITDGGSRARLRKLAPRMPRTIESIEVADDGGLVSITQYSGRSSKPVKPIPVNRLVGYIHDLEGGNWLGSSLLRPAYKHWLIKDRLLRVQAQTIERNGMGIPLYKGQEGASEADLAVGLAHAKAWRAGEAAGSAVPFGADLVLRGVEGQLPDADPAIRYHDEQIARAVLAHFLNLGTQTGSWALGTTFADFFTLSLQTLAQQVADTATQHIVEDLVDVNFGPDEPAPRVVFDEIGSRQAATAQALGILLDRGAIIPDSVLEEWLRQQYGMPPPSPDEPVERPVVEVTASADDDVMVDALVAALDEFSGRVTAADWDPVKHPRDYRGRFAKVFARIMSALDDWAAGEGPDNPLKGQGFKREHLLDAARQRGVKLRRGASEREVVRALLEDKRRETETRRAVPDDDEPDETPPPRKRAPAKKAAPKADKPEGFDEQVDKLRELDAEDARDSLDLLRVPELKELLGHLGLSKTGRKRELVDRLVDGTRPGESKADVPDVAKPADDTNAVVTSMKERQRREREEIREFNRARAVVVDGQVNIGNLRLTLADAHGPAARRRILKSIEVQLGKGQPLPASTWRGVAGAKGLGIKGVSAMDSQQINDAIVAHFVDADEARKAAIRARRVEPRDRIGDVNFARSVLDAASGDFHRVRRGGWGKGEYESDRGGDLLGEHLAERQGFDQLPEVIDRGEFEARRTKDIGLVLYRGINTTGRAEPGWGQEFTGKPASEVHDEFREGRYHVGIGSFGNGTYMTRNKQHAVGYSDLTEGSVARYALKRDVKVADLDDLSAEFDEWIRDLAGDSPEREVYGDLGRYAMARGYDAIHVPRGSRALGVGANGAKDQYVVLNRGKVVAEAREATDVATPARKAAHPGVSPADVRAVLLMGSHVPGMYLVNLDLTLPQWRRLGGDLGVPGSDQWSREEMATEAIREHFERLRRERAEVRIAEGLHFLGDDSLDHWFAAALRNNDGDPVRLRQAAARLEDSNINPADETSSWRASHLRAVADHIEASETAGPESGKAVPREVAGRPARKAAPSKASPKADGLDDLADHQLKSLAVEFEVPNARTKSRVQLISALRRKGARSPYLPTDAQATPAGGRVPPVPAASTVDENVPLRGDPAGDNMRMHGDSLTMGLAQAYARAGRNGSANRMMELRRRAATSAADGISPQQVVDELREIRAQESDPAFQRQLDMAIDGIDAPMTPIPDLPPNTPPLARKLMEDLHAIPYARKGDGDRGGGGRVRGPSLVDQLAEVYRDAAAQRRGDDGRSPADRVRVILRGKTHEINEAAFRIWALTTRLDTDEFGPTGRRASPLVDELRRWERGEFSAPPPPADPEEQARIRQGRIDQARDVGDMAAEIDQLIGSDARPEALRRRIEAAVRQRLAKVDQILGLTPAQRDEHRTRLAAIERDLLAAVDDSDELRERAWEHASDQGITKVGNVGSVETFDPARHKSIAGSIPAGTRVEVIQPGTVVDVDGQRVRLAKLLVAEYADSADSPAPVSVAQPPRLNQSQADILELVNFHGGDIEARLLTALADSQRGRAAVDALLANGMLRRDGARVKSTDAGRRAHAEWVAAAFDAPGKAAELAAAATASDMEATLSDVTTATNLRKVAAALGIVVPSSAKSTEHIGQRIIRDLLAKRGQSFIR